MFLRIPACIIALWSVPLIGWAQALRIDTVPAAPACPAPSVDTSGWLSIAGTDVPADVRLPRSFQEKRYDVTVGEIHRQEWRGELFTTFAIERRAGPDSLGDAKMVSQPSYQDYTECRIDIDGHAALVQSLRGGGTIFWDGKEFPSYTVHAVIQLAPGQYLRVSGGGPTRAAQEVLLTALRTIQIRAANRQ